MLNVIKPTLIGEDKINELVEIYADIHKAVQIPFIIAGGAVVDALKGNTYKDIDLFFLAPESYPTGLLSTDYSSLGVHLLKAAGATVKYQTPNATGLEFQGHRLEVIHRNEIKTTEEHLNRFPFNVQQVALVRSSLGIYDVVGTDAAIYGLESNVLRIDLTDSDYNPITLLPKVLRYHSKGFEIDFVTRMQVKAITQTIELEDFKGIGMYQKGDGSSLPNSHGASL